MVAHDTIDTVLRFNPCKVLLRSLRLADRAPLIVENIPCHKNNIRIFGIDLCDHLLHELRTGVVTQVQISDEDDFHAVDVPPALPDSRFISVYLYIAGMMLSIYGHVHDSTDYERPEDPIGPGAPERSFCALHHVIAVSYFAVDPVRMEMSYDPLYDPQDYRRRKDEHAEVDHDDNGHVSDPAEKHLHSPRSQKEGRRHEEGKDSEYNSADVSEVKVPGKR